MHTDITKTDISLSGIIEYKKSLEASEDVSDEVVELIEIAESLLQGKVDKVARLRTGLQSHLEALSAQQQSVQWMLDRVDAFLEETVTKAGGKLEGSAFSLRMQKNSQSSLIIDNEAQIPASFKNTEVSFKFPATDDDAMMHFASMKLNRLVEMKKDLIESEGSASIFYKLDVTPVERATLEHEFSVTFDKNAIKKAIKEGAQVPGAHTEQGSHLRVATVSAGSIKKKLEA